MQSLLHFIGIMNYKFGWAKCTYKSGLKIPCKKFFREWDVIRIIKMDLR